MLLSLKKLVIKEKYHLFLQLLTQVLTLFQTEIKWDSQLKKNQQSKILIKLTEYEDQVKITFTDISLGPSEGATLQTQKSQAFDHISKPLGVEIAVFVTSEEVHSVTIQMPARLETRF